MKRSEVEERLKWDTSSIYADDEGFYKDIEEIKGLEEELKKFKGKITSDLETFKSVSYTHLDVYKRQE